MFTISIDTRAVETSMPKVEKAIELGLAFTLTDSAKFANEDLIKAHAQKIDHPAPFTLSKSGYGLNMARIGSDNLYSEAYIKPAQAAYLKFIYEGGGVRRLGDAGASQKHAWVPGQRPGASPAGAYSVRPRRSPYGGVPNSYSKALYDLSKKDFAMTLRTAGATTARGRSSQGGVFYGTIKGKTGFWARPKRTAPIGGAKLERARKFAQNRAKPEGLVGPVISQDYRLGRRDANGRFVSSGRATFDTGGRKNRTTDVRVKNKGVPVLLLQHETATHHHQIVAYHEIMAAAHERSIGMAIGRIEHQLAKIH